MKSMEITIEQLKFDLQNPRFENLSDQRDILQKILGNQDKKLAVLAHDIVNQGLNPIDRMILIEDGNDLNNFIVLEGNRRLASLQLLSNPVLLNSIFMKPALKKKLQRYSEQFDRNAIEPIDGVLFDSREEASHWIELRHTGENAGAGIVGWDGIATARFRGNNVSLQAIEFVKKYGRLDKKGLEEFNITNLDRLLGDRYVRDILGLEIKNRKLGTSLPPEEVIKGLKKIISDIASERIREPRIHDINDRKSYIDSLSDSVKPKKDKTIDFWELDAPINFNTSAPAKRNIQPISGRKALIPKDCKLLIPDRRIEAIYKELRKMKAEEFPNAIAVLFRVFLELSVDYYVVSKKLSGLNEHSSLPKKIQATEKDLTANGINPDSLKPIRVATSDKDSFLACDTFHSYVHNMKMLPIPSELLIAWDRSQKFFEAIWS